MKHFILFAPFILFVLSANSLIGQSNDTLNFRDHPIGIVTDDGSYKLPDQYPEFPGGNGSVQSFETMVQSFLYKNSKYPQADKDSGISGQVIIRFVINETGKVENVTVLKGATVTMNAEASRVIRIMPSFKPAKLNGTPVKVYFVFPFNFEIGN